MTQAALELREQLSRLPNGDRAALAEFLLDSLDAGYAEELEAEWEAELRRREADFLSGKSVPIPADEALAQLRRKYETPL